MKTIKVNGIVIAENNLGDQDKMLTLLTPNLGKISCIAKGAKRPKSLLMAGTQLLCFGEYVLYKTGDIYSINSCEPIEVFYNIRTDLDKLTYVSLITKIISDVTTENQNNYNVLKLYLNTLYAISETEKDLDFILSVFKMRLLKILGYFPNISECTSCHEKNMEKLNYFSIRDNGFKCIECAKSDKGSLEISDGSRYAIIYSNLADSKKIFSFNLKEKAMEEFKLVSNIYFNEKLEKEYKIEKII